MSDRLPVVSGKQAVEAFARAGFVLLKGRGKGSHFVVHHPELRKLLTIPNHRELTRGTLRSLIRAAGLTVEEFRRLLP